ncbi:hypothetical protein BH11PLA1_BH11PLA1_21200 [soil metagenome]
MSEGDETSWDLSELLRAWPYEPGRLNVRVIESADGEGRIQMRLDLGILQMHMTGRPDGQRPRGFQSLLDFHEARLDDALHGRPLREEDDEAAGIGGADDDDDDESADDNGKSSPGMKPFGSAGGDSRDDDPEDREGPDIAGGGSSGGAPRAFKLSTDECRELREEAVQYYHRYMALLVLEDFEGVVRDTTRNLRVLDVCAKYAESEEDREALEPFRAYITMMRARALASQSLKDNEPKAALHAIDEGIDALRQHFQATGEDAAFETSGEVQMLRGMRESLVPKLPISPRGELKRRLEAAVKAENYELAAQLRDELKGMKD